MGKNEGYKRWTEELTDSGRLSQLKRKNPEQLSEEYVMPTDFFRREYKRLVGRPKEQSRERIKTLIATPRKRVILNKANTCYPRQAFTELLDNIFDNFDEEDRKELNIKISVFQYEGADEIIMRENSGGIKGSKQEPLVRLGEPHHSLEFSIGTWGEGFKIAAAALGSDIKVFTHYPGEKPVLINMDKYWWDNEEWEVPVYLADPESVPEGSTITVISNLKVKLGDISGEELSQYLGEVYGHKFIDYEKQGKTVKIAISAEEGREITVIPKTIVSDEDIKDKFAFPPYFSPMKVRYHWVKGDRELDALFIIGLTPHHSAETSGVTMFGNGRLFAKAIADKSVGYGNDLRSKLPAQHPSVQRLHIRIFFAAKNPYNIPWQAPLKDGYNENNVFSTEVLSAINDLAPKYVKFARYAKEHDIVPFSKEWETLSKDERLEMLFPNLDEDERKMKMENETIKALLEYEPTYTIAEYDGDKIDLSSEPFDISKAGEIQKLIKMRNDSHANVDDEDFLKIMFPDIFEIEEEEAEVEEEEEAEVEEEEVEEEEVEEEEVEEEEVEEEEKYGPDFQSLSEILAKKDQRLDIRVSLKVLKDDLDELKKIFGKKQNKELVKKAIKTTIVLKGAGTEEEE